MTDQVGIDIGNGVGYHIVSDECNDQLEQARYMRIRVDISIDKPFRRGGLVTSPEGEIVRVDYRYKWPPTFCYQFGQLGHEKQGCTIQRQSEDEQLAPYREWLRASFRGKLAGSWVKNVAKETKTTTAVTKGEEQGERVTGEQGIIAPK